MYHNQTKQLDQSRFSSRALYEYEKYNHVVQNPRILLAESDQIQYCEMCTDLIRCISSNLEIRDAEYEYDLTKLQIIGTCCLCALILKLVDHQLSSELWNVPLEYVKYRRDRLHLDKFMVQMKYNKEKETIYFGLGPNTDKAHIGVLASGPPRYEHFVSGTTDSLDCWNLAKTWLSSCRSRHDCEVTALSKKLPTRLIQIRESGLLFPRLIDSILLADTVEYCTLSHCWGDGNFLQLQKGNYKDFYSLIPYDLLSKTFRDAIYAANILGFSYIWIDSLCIVQGDKEDWAREAGTMSNVYANSSLNLAATSARRDDGLFTTRQPSKILPCLTRPLHHDIKEMVLFDRELWQLSIEASVLARRAWVVQELFLAPRTLYFGQDQLFWECSEGSCCETFPWDPITFYTPIAKSVAKSERGDLSCTWDSLLLFYSHASLSFGSDMLVAISGIARHLSNRGLGEYVAGLWRNGIEHQLLWRTGSLYTIQYGHLPLQYRAPSWSWAALEDTTIHSFGYLKAIYFQGFVMKYYYAIRVIGFSLEPKYQGDVFGELNGGSMTIQCSSLKKMPQLECNERGEIQQLYDSTETICVIPDTRENEPGPRFLLFVMTFESHHRENFNNTRPWPFGVTGLVLENADHQVECFKRVGTFWIDGYPSSRICRSGEYFETFRDCDNDPPPWVDDGDSQSNSLGADEFSNGSTTQDKRQSKSRFRSSIWSRLEDAEMSWEAQQKVTLDPDFEKQFIITLI
ncbi:heterokaryon incompatibility protein-domain-containing protein [Bisporella sp. PMI_857]|nr:heterokaryon incompatibility protein-domain-containing protein [Bisporella sp. PMI_857]